MSQQQKPWQPGMSFLPFSPGAPKSFAPGTIRFVPKSQWVPDSKSKICFLCPQIKFGMKHRRHHCRLCGQVCCGDCTKRRHPKYPDTRICTPCYSMIMVGENSLQSAGWYHGALKRPLCEQRLLSPGTRYGDFLVRESGSVDGYIALSVRSGNKVLHYLIREKFGKFFVGNEAPGEMFPSIQNLITESKAKYGLHRAMIVESFKGTACPQCGATVDQEMEFCEECGTRLRSTAEQIKLYEDQGTEENYEDDGNTGAAPQQQVYDDDDGTNNMFNGGPALQQQGGGYQQMTPNNFQQSPPQQQQGGYQQQQQQFPPSPQQQQPQQQQFQQQQQFPPPQQQFQQQQQFPPPQQQFQQQQQQYPPQQQFQQQQFPPQQQQQQQSYPQQSYPQQQQQIPQWKPN